MLCLCVRFILQHVAKLWRREEGRTEGVYWKCRIVLVLQLKPSCLISGPVSAGRNPWLQMAVLRATAIAPHTRTWDLRELLTVMLASAWVLSDSNMSMGHSFWTSLKFIVVRGFACWVIFEAIRSVLPRYSCCCWVKELLMPLLTTLKANPAAATCCTWAEFEAISHHSERNFKSWPLLEGESNSLCMWTPEWILRCSSDDGTRLHVTIIIPKERSWHFDWRREHQEDMARAIRSSTHEQQQTATRRRVTRECCFEQLGKGHFMFSGDPWGSVSHRSQFFICLGEPFIGVPCHGIWSHISSFLSCRRCQKKSRPRILTTQWMTHGHGEKTRFVWML